ncbi:ECF transporter S component [Proteinivorax hydrogeniformans]|uniref:ECF transporter S component n=1 Tax=Proteinivorax hydrogeniformans TaxID=1826727 RepID=A0AAU8HVA6_9FIRM
MNNLALKSNKIKTVTIAYSAMLIALSYVGSLIKVQGSIAFDSMPAFFGALLLGPAWGGVIGFVGHLLTAVTSGFPMTLPMHAVIAVQMAFFVFAFGWLCKKTNYYVSGSVATILNGPGAALVAVPFSMLFNLPLSGWALFKIVIIPLTLASAANVLLAVMLYKIIGNRIK